MEELVLVHYKLPCVPCAKMSDKIKQGVETDQQQSIVAA